MRRRPFLPSRPGRSSLYIVFLIVATVAIIVVIMVIESLEDGVIGLTLFGVSLLLARAYTLVLAGLVWRYCHHLNPGRHSEEDAKTIAMRNFAVFMLSLLLLV